MVFTPPSPLSLDLASPFGAIAQIPLIQNIQDSKFHPVNIAILGAGRWGTHLLRNFAHHPRSNVVAVVDPCAERLTAVAAEFQLDRVKLIQDWSETMNLPGLEAVAIATPAATHYPLIRAALQQGLHVLAEKPLTLEVVEALELCHLAAQQQRQLVVDHTYLFHPAVQQGKAVLPRLGSPRYGYATRTHLGPVRSDVDALWDLAIHDIAIFNYWLDEVPIQVQAQGKTWLQTVSNNSRFPNGLSDLVWVKLLYPSGFQASIHLCWSNPDKQRRLCLAGSHGTLVFDELAPDTPLTLLEGGLSQGHQAIDQHRHVFSLEDTEPLHQVCDHFLTCVRENQPSDISSGWLGAELVQILSALSQSLNQDGQPVSLKLKP
ncbi:MAG: Gfo/Idh/MocA family oxidoreductase [Drouetiella hepatica Uher 2000/2452]|uniref:Gfo/Idh/MocA family oxidoreductase n=1 Tax=Drouetiella hepatica Uher 2000/2452 TaxID=904376 RepID=A0A951QBP9_9CYAN|nr:Gfo/Idh/MocA family oxidoreductase [Drouetiella hepatica Uher 2000/2452]